MENTLILEEIQAENIDTPQIEVEEKAKFCLNCGTPVNDKFCPHCGQSTSVPEKLKMKNFGKGVIMSFGRLTPGFFNTAKGLIIHPWKVIRDHIHGKHVPYSPPITMLIQIMLYSTIIFACLDAILGTHTNVEESIFGYEGNNPILKMIDTSVVISTLIAAVPICLSVYLAYYRHGAKKYNFAEYLAAFTYMFAAVGLWDTFFSFFNLIPGIETDFTIITIFVAAFYSIIILYKAFPQKKKLLSIALIMWCSFLLMFGIIIIGLIMSLPRAIEYFTTH